MSVNCLAGDSISSVGLGSVMAFTDNLREGQKKGKNEKDEAVLLSGLRFHRF